MFNRRRTPFSSMMCDTVWISVVERTGSSTVSLPFESIRCDAKIVLMRVDFPSPVWPKRKSQLMRLSSISLIFMPRTNTDNIELETAFK